MNAEIPETTYLKNFKDENLKCYKKAQKVPIDVDTVVNPLKI